MIIDGDVEIFPAGTGRVVMAIGGEAVASALDACELFDVEVEEFAGLSVLVAAQRPRWFQGTLAGETVTAQQTRDGGLGDFGLTSDLEAGQFATVAMSRL